jgi:hypothetical protein
VPRKIAADIALEMDTTVPRCMPRSSRTYAHSLLDKSPIVRRGLAGKMKLPKNCPQGDD